MGEGVGEVKCPRSRVRGKGHEPLHEGRRGWGQFCCGVPDVGRVGVRSDIGLALGVGGVVYDSGGWLIMPRCLDSGTGTLFQLGWSCDQGTKGGEGKGGGGTGEGRLASWLRRSRSQSSQLSHLV